MLRVYCGYFRLIWNQTDVRLVPNQSENDLIRFRKDFSVCRVIPSRTKNEQVMLRVALVYTFVHAH